MSAHRPYYEIRLYKCVPGRIPALHRRMTHEVLPIFAANGVTLPLAYWTGYGGPRAPLYAYMLKWDSMDHRMVSFRRFYADPSWHKHLEETNAGGTMVDRMDVFILRPEGEVSDILSPTITNAATALHELRLQHVLSREPAAAMSAWRNTELPALRERGAVELGTFTMWYGERMPQMVSLLGWRDAAARQAAVEACDVDPAIAEFRAEERRRYGQPLLGRGDVHLLQPAFRVEDQPS